MRFRYPTLLSCYTLVLSAAVACHAVAPRSPRVGAMPAGREVRLTRDLSLTGITWIVEIREEVGGGPAAGEMRATTGDVNRRGVEREFGCRARTSREDWAPWTCTVPFRRGAPDWAAALARLDALGVMEPPRDAPPGDGERRPMYVCNDGTPWTLEVRQGGVLTVQDAQVCGPTSARRAAFEAGVDSVFDAVVATARAR